MVCADWPDGVCRVNCHAGDGDVVFQCPDGSGRNRFNADFHGAICVAII